MNNVVLDIVESLANLRTYKTVAKNPEHKVASICTYMLGCHCSRLGRADFLLRVVHTSCC